MARQRAVWKSFVAQNDQLQAIKSHLEQQSAELQETSSALRREEAALEERTRVLGTTLQHIDQGIMMIDADGIVVVYNHRVVELMDFPETLLASRPTFAEILEYQWGTQEFSRTNASLRDFVRRGGLLDKPQRYERERPNGVTVEVRSQPLPGGGVVRTFTDVTERKRAEALVERAALYDDLTGLASRLALLKTLESRTVVDVKTRPASLLYLSLDRFRLLNDARGHEIGDRVLVEVARRLRAACPAGDLISRVGGDEFAVFHIVEQEYDNDESFSGELLKRLAEPHEIDGLELFITVSIGVVRAEPSSSAATLLRNADIALGRAKQAGRNQVAHYRPAMTAMREERFQIEQLLREAISQNAFRLAYQPIVNVTSRQVSGYEALIRWTDSARGEMSPSVFIPVAESTGLIVPLGRSILEWACFEAAGWTTQRTVAVNLSPAQFQGGEIVKIVEDVLERSGLAPHRLELEVTEGMLLEDTGSVLETMKALQTLGVGITLDDFGTGHAGLSYLRRFPFQKIKIDRSFICNLGKDRESDAIVGAVMLLGQRLSIPVVAEGVETEAQFEELKRMNCPFIQGYLTGRPMSPELARGLV